MEGSITQLGLSNYLINKQGSSVSFFNYAYKNHKNFVKDTRVLSFKNGFEFDKTSNFRFDEDGRYGDLITGIVIEVELPDISNLTNANGNSVGYCNGVGNALFKNIEFRIGGNLIDQQSSEWMDIWGQLEVKPGCRDVYNTMIQKYDDSAFTTTSFQGGKVYIPLFFWFCRNVTNKNSSLVFPLNNLYNSTSELIVDIRSFKDLLVTEDGTYDGIPNKKILDASIVIDYVVLEEEERDHYLKIPKQLMLINQVQAYSFDVSQSTTFQLFSLKSMRYLVTEIFFVLRTNTAVSNHDYFNYSTSLNTANKANPIASVRLIFDGRDRIRKTEANVFSLLEPAKVHTNIPQNKFIHCYSFSLEPAKIEQPNGACNFSELQDPQLHLEFKEGNPAATLYVFATNYNVLQAKEGYGWLLHNLSKSVPAAIPKNNQTNNLSDSQ